MASTHSPVHCMKCHTSLSVIYPNCVANGSLFIRSFYIFIYSVRWSVYSLVWFFDSGPSQVTTSTQGECVSLHEYNRICNCDGLP